jgi:uncharacterized Zn-binding protein involved in type VI secretion
MLCGRAQLNKNLQGDFSILQQISALRRENRFLKVGLVFCLVLSAMPYLTGFQPETINVKQVSTERLLFLKDGKPFLVIAPHSKDNALVAVSIDRTPVAVIKWTQLGGQIGVYNKEGNPVVGMGASPEGGGVEVGNKDGKPVVGMGALPEGGRVEVRNKDGKTVVSADVIEGHGRVAIWNGKPQAVAMMAALPFGGGIALTDENGKIVWTAP